MGDHDARDIHRQVAVAELVEMENVRLNLLNDRGQVRGGLGIILLAFVHPFQAKPVGR